MVAQSAQARGDVIGRCESVWPDSSCNGRSDSCASVGGALKKYEKVGKVAHINRPGPIFLHCEAEHVCIHKFVAASAVIGRLST